MEGVAAEAREAGVRQRDRRVSLGTHGPTSARGAGAQRPRPRGLEGQLEMARPSDWFEALARQTACISQRGRQLHGAHGGNGDPMPSPKAKQASKLGAS